MKLSAIWNIGSQTFNRPMPCTQQPCECKYCERPEFDECEYDDCKTPTVLDAVQVWFDEWRFIRFDGYYHPDCYDLRYMQGP